MNLGKIRAFQIDLARQIETLPTIFRFFDVAARSGFNMCVLYLEDRIIVNDNSISVKVGVKNSLRI